MNRSNISRIASFLFLSLTISSTELVSVAYAEVPVVFWHSQPVKPTQTVMVQGHAISTATEVDAQRLVDSSPGSPVPITNAQLTSPTRITPLSFGESILNFVIPENWQNGIFAYRLVNDLIGAVKLVNAPDPWFFQGDQGNRATPGGWVAVFGNSLAITGGTARLSLANNGAEVIQLAARTGGNGYAQYFDLPANLQVGSYQIYVHNGFGGPAAWTRLMANETVGSDLVKIVSRDTLWETLARAQPEVVIDAANGNGGAANWDAVFAAAIAAVKLHKDATGKALGGVIRIKPGTYTLDKYLVLPDKAILAGDFGNRDTTILQWGDSATHDPAGKNSLIIGETLVVWPAARGTFSVEDLTLSRTSATRVGVCIERAYTNIEEQSAWFRRITCSELNTAEAATTAVTAGEVDNNRPGLWMRSTKNTEISNCTIDMVTGISLIGNNASNDFVRIENNTFRWRYAPLNLYYGLKNLVYSGNTELMLGTENANGIGAAADVGDSIGSFGHNVRDIYFAQNQMLREGADAPYIHQGLTLDGNAGVYLGKITSVTGTTINLAGVTSVPQPNTSVTNPLELRPRGRVGAMVQILSGKGAGQWRHLASPALDSITNLPVNIVQIDRPWDVEPDTASWLSINDFQGRMIFYGNNLDNAPKFQPYYASHDVIIAENLMCTKQNPVIPVWVGYRGGGYGSMTHGWHYQVLENIASGNYPVSMPTIITSLDKSETIVPQWGSYPGYDGSYVSTHIYRDNHNSNSPVFEISPNSQNTGFLIENNTGLSSILFLEPPFKQEMGLIRNNASPVGNRPQLNELSAYRYTTDPGSNVVYSYTDVSTVNLARSGVSTASNDFGGYGRSFPVDGRTGTLWASNEVASSGNAAQPWFQVDLRTSNVIQSVKIWPRLDPGLETSDVWVLVSPTPFTSNDLDTERARPEIFSQFLAGKFTDARTIDLTAVQGGKYVGRYVRAWKTFLPGTGALQLSEIEVFGYSNNSQSALAVHKNGTGSVTSNPTGINCGSGCSAVYNANSIITLTANATAGSVFTGWSGGCSGTLTTCSITIDTSKSVTATFDVVPVANAGPSQTASQSGSVTLLGSGSDTDGTIVSYQWLQIAGPAVTLFGASTSSPSFIAPAVSADTILSFQLTVTDNLGATSVSSTDVMVTASAIIQPTSNDNDVPTLPEWALMLLGLSLFCLARRSRQK
jgi:hypothetical protein